MKVVVLSYYNPWISGGGHRPVCFLEEDLKKGHEVVFVFESLAEVECMPSFGLYKNPNLKLIRRDKHSGAFESMNSQAKDIVSEDYLLDVWKPDYIRSHNPVGSYIELLKRCKKKKIPHLYDQMDYWDGFPVQPWGECTEDAYIDLAVSNMTISNWLVEKNSLKTPKPFAMIPNAIKENFAEELSISYNEVERRNLKERKTVVYSGAIWPEWFDWDIMSYLIEMRPQYDFLMIGAYKPSSDEDDGRNVREIVAKLKTFDNVSFLGQISHMELIPHLQSSNVSIIPFVVNDVTEACSPLKCFEYLGASLPVVTTALPEIKDYPMVFAAHSKEKFLELLDSLLGYGITEEQYLEMKMFVDNNTWKARSNALEDVAIDMLSQGE